MSEMIEDLEGAEVIVDDIIVWGQNVQEHDKKLKCVLERVEENNLKLNLSKCRFRKEEVIYVGHKISKNGLEADPEKIRAVKDMKKTENKKEVQTFLGFITYLQKFLPHISEISAPLRKLLEKKVDWYWDTVQEESFNKLKEMATKTPVLAFYNPKNSLTLNVDSSSYGLGAVLLQNDRPIAYASRALNPTQQKYSQIEKETLAIVFGCEKFYHYVYGREFIVETDHKPLENIFRKSISEAPARIVRFLMQLQKYDFKVKYKAGNTMYVSDLLSRMNLPETLPDIDINQVQLNSHLPMSPEKYKELIKATSEDDDLICVKSLIENGWPNQKYKVPLNIREYWSFRDELTCVDGILYKGLKVIIPKKLRPEMLEIVHQTHRSIVACKRRAREFMFWVRMLKQIQEKVERCHICALNNQKNNHKEPMISSEIPDRPSSKVGADLFELHGQHYLLTVDYYSKWPEVEKLDNLTSSNVKAYLKKQFARYGYIDELVTDNGPQFSSHEFKKFAKDYQFIHTTSSPHYSQSMGQTERYVQTMKQMIKKSSDSHKALLDYRNTPLEGVNKSPAQLHVGRRLKSSLPVRAELLKEVSKSVSKNLRDRQLKSENYYNKHSGHPLKELEQNQRVMINHNNKLVPWKVIGKHETPRSYIVETMGGRKLRRNRYHLKATKASFQPVLETEGNGKNYIKTESNQTTKVQSKPVPHSNQEQKTSAQPPEKQACEKPGYKTRSGRAVKMPGKFSDFVC